MLHKYDSFIKASQILDART